MIVKIKNCTFYLMKVCSHEVLLGLVVDKGVKKKKDRACKMFIT